jgi:hypothetical protein
MSINALTNAAVARRSDFQPEGAVPTSLAEIASAAVAAPVPIAKRSKPFTVLVQTKFCEATVVG